MAQNNHFTGKETKAHTSEGNIQGHTNEQILR